MFELNGAAFVESPDGPFDMPYIWCPEEHGYDARRFTLVASIRKTPGFCDELQAYLVLDQLHEKLRFLNDFSRWRRDCDFELQMRVRRCPVYVAWHNV